MYIKFKRNSVLGENMSYLFLEKYSDEESLFLGKFLVRDLSVSWVESYKKWALSSNQLCASGNETYQEKEGGLIYIGDLFLEDPLEGPCYKLTTEEFIDLLDQWKAAVLTKPNAITITKENERLVVKAELES